MNKQLRTINGQTILVTICPPARRKASTWGRGYGRAPGLRGAAFLAQELNNIERAIDRKRIGN